VTTELRDLPVRAVDCLKYIYKMRERGEKVTTSAMRELLETQEQSGQLSDAAVTQLFKLLAKEGFVEHTPYRGVELTPRGEAVAAESVRHHRLLELFLARQLGYSLDEVDAEAEKLEHAISESFEDRLDTLLGHPVVDPHGDPIPNKAGEVIDEPSLPLTQLEPGREAVVRRVSDDNAEMLRYLTQLGLVPGTRVQMRGREPFEGPLRVFIGEDAGGQERVIGVQVAGSVRVAPTTR